MLNLKTALFMAVAISLSACTAASHQEAAHTVDSHQGAHSHDTATSKVHGHVATVKPGASVSMVPTLPKTMVSGAYQTVQLKFDEGYGDGSLSVTIEPSEGLQLFGGASAKTFDMTSPQGHVWDLDVKADADGVYFLNIFAEAKGQFRTFSVRLDMGQITQKMIDIAMPSNGELADGGKIRVLEAEETIK